MKLITLIFFFQSIYFIFSCICPFTCSTCDEDCKCLSCFKGFWGNSCEKICSLRCRKGCYLDSGDCKSCDKKHSGSNCKILCNSNCIYGCDQNDKDKCKTFEEAQEDDDNINEEENINENNSEEENINNDENEEENINDNNNEEENVNENNSEEENINNDENEEENINDNNKVEENINDNNEEENINDGNKEYNLGECNHNNEEGKTGDNNKNNNDKKDENNSDSNKIKEYSSNEMAFSFVSEHINNFYTPNEITNIKQDSFTITIYDTNQKFENRFNESHIILSLCETELKKYYNIPLNEPLIIVKMDSETDENFPTKKVNYEIFSLNKTKLDKKICSKITMEIPIKEDTKIDINELMEMQNNGIDLTDKTDAFFNDICVPYDNDDKGTPFNERKNLYVNISFCDVECNLNSIKENNGIYEVICDCGQQYAEEAQKKREGHFVKSILNSNIFVVRCYKVVFNLKRLKVNWGHWFYFTLIILQLINLCFFGYYGYKSLRKYLRSLIHHPASPILNANKNDDLKIKSNDIMKLNIKGTSNNNLIFISSTSNVQSKDLLDNNHMISILETDNEHQNMEDIANNNNLKTEIYGIVNNSINNNIIIKKEKKKKIDDPSKFTEDQLESFPYQKAILYDKRGFKTTYIYSILRKQGILNAIFIDSQSKFRCIKFSTIMISVALSFGFNALFFSQSLQNKSYKGDNSLLIRIPKVLISFFSSIICIFILNLVSSYENNLNKFIKKKKITKKKIKKFLKKVNCKVISFYCLAWFYTLFFWYFCTAYCAIYPLFQKPWFYDSLQTLFLAHFSPFIFCLMYVGFRVSGIKCKIYAFFLIGKFFNLFLDTKYKKFLKLCQ